MNKKMTYSGGFALAFSFAAFSLSAQAIENNPDADPFFQEMPIVLTASRLAQPLSEAPSAVTVIDKKMIKASGFRTVPELMRLVPGMYVSFSDANNPIVSLHGATDEFSRRMQVLLDGRSIYLPPLGSVSWADLPVLIDDIERIEVVRGPSSAAHGTNSFYGVINIITTRPGSGDGPSITVTAGHATDVSARVSSSGEQLDYRLSIGRRTDKGFDNNFYFDRNATNVANFVSNYRLSLSDTIEAQLGHSAGIYGAGLSGRIDAFGNITTREDSLFRDTTSESDFQKITWVHLWTGGDESKLTFSRTARAYVDPLRCIDSKTCDGDTSGKTSAEGFAVNGGYTQRNELELQNTNQLGGDNRLVWGSGMRTDFTENPLTFQKPQQINTWQVFAHDEWHVSDAAVINIGTMYEDNGMGSRNSSPRASLNYHFTPQHTVRVGVSTATRSASLAEAYVEANNKLYGGVYIQPLTPLTPEKIVSKEIAYLGEFQSIGLTLDARAYIDQVTDMIFTDLFPRLADESSVKNMITADFKGLEATVKYHWDEKHSFLSFNYAYQEASAHFVNYPTQFFNPDPYYAPYGTIGAFLRDRYLNVDQYPARFNQIVPSHSYSVLISEQFADAWQLSAGYYYRGEVRAIAISPDVSPEYQMSRLDLRLAKTFKFDGTKSAEIAIVVQNATQDNYNTYDVLGWKFNKDNAQRSSLTYPRRAWISATFNF